jgi:DNA-binding transcriptional MerR regulator
MAEKQFTIDELARASGMTTRTIRFYCQEKLLSPPADFRGRTALYSREHLEKLKFIKILKDKYLPLDMIKKVSTDPEKLAHLQEKLKINVDVFELLGYKPATLTRQQLAKKSGIDEAEIAELVKWGFLTPSESEDGERFTADDVEIIGLLGNFRDFGLEPEEVVFIPNLLQELTNTLFDTAHSKFHETCVGKENKAASIQTLVKANRKLIDLIYQQSLRRTHRRAVERHNHESH